MRTRASWLWGGGGRGTSPPWEGEVCKDSMRASERLGRGEEVREGTLAT